MSDPHARLTVTTRKDRPMKLPADTLQPGDDLRFIDGTWITVRMVAPAADLLRVWATDGRPSFTVRRDARWDIRKFEISRATVTATDSETVRERAAARFAL